MSDIEQNTSTRILESDDTNMDRDLNLSQLSISDYFVHDPSPLDIYLTNITHIIISPIIWSEVDTIPLEMTVQNTGKMLNVDSEYSGRKPSLNGSLLRCPYEFWHFHFHWATKNDDSRKHSIMGKRFPMEIHLIFYNTSYVNIDEALNGKDGILILAFMCKLAKNENLILRDLTSNLEKVSQPGQSTNINPFPLSTLFNSDFKNYLSYWGVSGKNDYPILLMISSKLISISESQLSSIRSLKVMDDACIASNCRSSKTVQRYKLFRVNQSTCTVENLLRNVENDVEQTIPNPSELPIRMIPVTETVSNTHNVIRFDIEESKSNELLETPTKSSVLRIISDLSKKLTSNLRGTIKMYRDGVRMNSTALKREKHIKNKLQNQNAFEKKKIFNL